MPKQSTLSKELIVFIETLPPMKTSELIRLTGGKYSKDTCRYALIRYGKLLLTEAERHKDIVAEIKASPTPLTSAYIRKKYGVASNTATNLLRSCGKFSRVRLDSCHSIAKSLPEPMLARDFAQKYKKSLKQSRKALSRYGKLKRVEARQRCLKLTAKQIAETLTEPISAKEFSEKYNKTLKITYKALKETGKLKPVPTGKPRSNGAVKPPSQSEPAPKRSTSDPKPRQQKSSFDKFYSNFSKYAKRIQDDEFAYID